MFDPTIGRWTTEDPIRVEAADANLFRYLHNNPVNLRYLLALQAISSPENRTRAAQASLWTTTRAFNTAAALVEEKKDVCSIKEVYFIKDKKDLPGVLQRVPPAFDAGWDPRLERKPNVIGPLKDPNKRGNAAYVLWVAFEGENLADCVVKRYFVSSFAYGR